MALCRGGRGGGFFEIVMNNLVLCEGGVHLFSGLSV